MTDDPTPATSDDANLPNPLTGVRWGLWEVASGLVVFLTLLAGVSILATATPLRDAMLANLELVGFVSSIVAYGGLLLVIVIASRRLGLRRLADDFGLRFRPVDILIGLGIGILGRIVTVLVTIVTISLTGYTPPRGNFVLASEPLWIALNGFVIAAIVAPFIEELFFRGLFLRSVRNRVLRRAKTQPTDAATNERAAIIAIAVSSVAFMALHLYQADNWTLFIILGVSTLFVGVLNGFVAVRTGRIGGPIIGHLVFNGSAVLLSLLAV